MVWYIVYRETTCPNWNAGEMLRQPYGPSGQGLTTIEALTTPHETFLFLQAQIPPPLKFLGPLAIGLLLVAVAASAVIEVTDLVAVKQRLVQPRVHLVVHKARPARGGLPTARLGRVFGEELAEVSGAVAAGVEA